jgi:hypothetical protein
MIQPNCRRRGDHNEFTFTQAYSTEAPVTRGFIDNDLFSLHRLCRYMNRPSRVVNTKNSG